MVNTLTTLTAVAYPSTVASDGLLAFVITGANVQGGDTLSSFAVTGNNSSVVILEGPSSLSIPQGQTVSSVLIVKAAHLLGTVTYQITAQSSAMSGTLTSNTIPIIVQTTNPVQPVIVPSSSKHEKKGWIVFGLLFIAGVVGIIFYRRSRCCKPENCCATSNKPVPCDSVKSLAHQ